MADDPHPPPEPADQPAVAARPPTEDPALGLTAGAAAALYQAFLAHPQQVGRYQVLEPIGEGGMGVVYKAEQRHPINRIVALKVLKPGLETSQVLARFDAERQALALMDHSNIAAVFDAGATEVGRPYFVMEYVPGEPITTFCDRHRYTIAQRLELFIQACEAIQHAHTKAIIHRDIKPSNLLVMLQDDRPLLKVIDFGVAKATGHRLTERTMFTEAGQLIGTPEYMSPEQAEMGVLDVDTRTDVYSLGVVLYELLTGVLPFDLTTIRQAPPERFQQLMRDLDPPTPSSRLSRIPDRSQEIARSRRTELMALVRALREELEWIPLKAMRKERSERYRSAAELADDARNYLARRPLLAGPQTAVYRLRKYARKHARLVAAAVGAVVMLLGLVAVLAAANVRVMRARVSESQHRLRAESEARRAGAEARRAEDERDRAVRAEAQANEQRRRAELLLADATVEQARELHVAGAVTAAWSQIEKARQQYDRLGLSPLPAEFALLEMYDARPPPMLSIEGHDQMIHAVAATPDGTRIVSGSFDGTVRVWDARFGREVWKMDAGGYVTSIHITPDGNVAISTGATVKLWDLRNGTLLRTLPVEGARVSSFVPEGERLVIGGHDHVVRVFELRTGNEILKLPPQATAIRSLAVSKDGKALFVGLDIFAPKGLITYDLGTGQEQWAADTPMTRGGVRAIALFEDGRRLAMGSYRGDVEILDLESRQGRILNVGADVLALGVRPDTQSLLVGTAGGHITEVKPEASEVRLVRGGARGIRAIDFLAGGRVLLAAGIDKAISLWDLDAPGETRRSTFQSTDWSDLGFRLDGLVTIDQSYQDSLPLAWDTATGKLLAVLDDDDPLLDSVGGTAQPTMRWVSDGLVGLDAADHVAWKLTLDLANVHDVGEIDAQRTLVLIRHRDSTATVWDYGRAQLVCKLLGHAPAAWHLLPEGGVLSAGQDGTLRRWELPSGQERYRRAFPSNAPAVDTWLSPNCRRIAVGHVDGVIGIYDVESGAEVESLRGHAGPAHALHFSDDLRFGVSVGDDGTVRVWDVAEARQLFRLPEQRMIESIEPVFSPDLEQLVIVRRLGTDRREIRWWDLHRPVKRRAHQQQLRAAAVTLASDPGNVDARVVFGEWYALVGMDPWAIELLEAARSAGAKGVSSLTVGRCYWLTGRTTEAVREFHRAIERGEAPEQYLRMCIRAVEQPPPLSAMPTTRPTTRPKRFFPQPRRPTSGPIAPVASAVDPLDARNIQAWKLRRDGKLAEAEALRRSVVAEAAAILPKNDAKLVKYRIGYGELLAQMKRFEEAEAQYRLVEAALAIMPDVSAQKVDLHQHFARLYLEWDKPEQARKYQDRLSATQPATRRSG